MNQTQIGLAREKITSIRPDLNRGSGLCKIGLREPMQDSTVNPKSSLRLINNILKRDIIFYRQKTDVKSTEPFLLFFSFFFLPLLKFKKCLRHPPVLSNPPTLPFLFFPVHWYNFERGLRLCSGIVLKYIFIGFN